MDSSSIAQIKQSLSKKQINPKQMCNWDNSEQVQKLMILLKQMQFSLQSEMQQSIDSHLVGKQKAIAMMKQALPFLQRQKIRSKEPEPELINIIQMTQIKTKIDYCLQKVNEILNPN